MLLACRTEQSPVNSPHKGQWRGALMFSWICAWINASVHNREAGTLRRHRAHYDVIAMSQWNLIEIHFHSRNTFENVVCQMSAILFRPSCMKIYLKYRSPNKDDNDEVTWDLLHIEASIKWPTVGRRHLYMLYVFYAYILTYISLKFVPKGPIVNNPALIYVIVWQFVGDNPWIA